VLSTGAKMAWPRALMHSIESNRFCSPGGEARGVCATHVAQLAGLEVGNPEIVILTSSSPPFEQSTRSTNDSRLTGTAEHGLQQ